MSLIGQQIDRYRLVRLLGSGGMGDVYLAEDARIGQQVAIKVIRSEVSPYPNEPAAQGTFHRFEREAKAIVMLDHPHILQLFDYGEQLIGEMTVVYLVMPYRQEGSLAQWLNKREQARLLSPYEVDHIVQQAAAALQHAHDHRIIHQDVKPSNFLIRARKDDPLHPDILLADFGIARLMTTTSSASQSVRGTPTYMSPEQCIGNAVPASDQYALAVMAYELLTGRPPFQGAAMQVMYQHTHDLPQPPSKLNPRLSREVDIVLLRGLAKKPEERFGSISDFARAFHHAMEGMRESEIPTLVTPSDTLPASLSRPHTMQAPMTPSSGLTQTISSPPTTMAAASVTPSGAGMMDNSGVHTMAAPDIFVTSSHTSSGTQIAAYRRAKLRPLLIAALVLLASLLLVSGIVYALPGIRASLTQHQSSTTTQHQSGTTSPRSSTLSSATVTITPANIDLKHTFTISAVTGTPNASKQQVGARLLSFTTSSYTQTAQATGIGTIPGTHASGTVAIDNFNTSSSLTLTAGSVFANTYGTVNIHMVLDATVTVPPAPSSTVWSQGTAPGHILEIGTIGNNEFNNNINGTLTWSVFDNPPFSNGKDPQNYTAVQQSDIDGAANTLIAANTPNPQQVLQGQVRSNERLIGTPQCASNKAADHAAGDRATTVTVTISFTCTGEAYDQDGALALASSLLSQQAATDPGSGYNSVGKITTTLTSAMLSDATNGTITLTVDTQGTWRFQFTSAQKQALLAAIAGQPKGQAETFLLGQKGVAKVDMQISGGDGNTLPTDWRRITMVVNTGSV